MNNTFTLSELLLAEMLIFPADLERMWTKHTSDAGEAQYMMFMLKSKYKGKFLSMVQEYAPANKEVLDVFTKILNDVLGR